MKEVVKYSVNSLYGIIARHKHNNKVALFCEEKKLTYSLLNKYVENLALILEVKNIKNGDRVAILIENSIEYVIAMFAISRLGAVIVPINTFLSSREIEYIINDANISVLISSVVFEKKVTFNISKKLFVTIWIGEKSKQGTKDIHFVYEKSQSSLGYIKEYNENNFSLDEDAMILYTSGTSGKPKGVILTNKNILSNAGGGIIHADVTKKDRFIVFLPMFHAFTLSIGIVLPLYAGGSIVIIRSVQPFRNIIKEILFKRVTIVLGVPDVYKALANATLPWYFLMFNNIHSFVSGASPLHKNVLDAMNKKFKSANVLEAYGLTEASPTVSLNPRTKQKLNSVGTPFPGYKIKIIKESLEEAKVGEVGEVLVSGDNIMKGYLNNPKETRNVFMGTYLKTGDLGYLDSEGYLFLVDRKKDLIISKGMNIYPREIEVVLNEHLLVKESAVIGEININGEEIVSVFIEYHKEDIDILKFEKILKKYLKNYLAAYKIPKNFYFSNKLEKNAMGKINKSILKKDYVRKKEC